MYWQPASTPMRISQHGKRLTILLVGVESSACSSARYCQFEIIDQHPPFVMLFRFGPTEEQASMLGAVVVCRWAVIRDPRPVAQARTLRSVDK